MAKTYLREDHFKGGRSLSLVKSLGRSTLRDSAAAERALSIESRIFRYAPNLCHSLVVTAVNTPR